MSEADEVQLQLRELQSCSADAMHSYFSNAGGGRLFTHLLPAQKNEIAQSFYQWASELADEQPLKFSFAELILALSYHLNDEHENALHYLSMARNHFAEQHYEEGIGICDVLYGSIYRTFGNYDLALKTCWNGYALLKQSPHYWTFLSGCTNTIANINFEMRNYDEALRMFLVTYEESEAAGDDYFTIYALQGLGKVNSVKQRYEIAKEFFQKALKLSEKANAPMSIANSLTELADHHFKLEEYAEAEELNKKALAIRERNNLTGAAITNCLHLGEIYIRLSKWDDALEVLNIALTKAEKIKVKPKMYRAHYLLSQVYENKNDLEQSLQHFKQFHQLRQQVEEEDNARKLADAKLLFEAEQAKKENVIIKNQKAEIEKKNIELRDTIYELTLERISRKAKIFTWIFAIILFIFQDYILHIVLGIFSSNSYFLPLLVKMAIIFSLSPINSAIEHFLLKRVVKIKNPNQVALT